MASVNKVILVGNLGADPEMRYMPSGDAVCNMRVATTDRYTDKQTGQPKESTEWHRVNVFGRLAENCGQYLHKGSPVYIEGRIKTRKWQDQSGQDKYSTEIVAERVQFLPAPNRDDGGYDDRSTHGGDHPQQQRQQRPQGGPPREQTPGQRARQQAQGQPPAQQRRAPPSNGFEDMDDDIPF